MFKKGVMLVLCFSVILLALVSCTPKRKEAEFSKNETDKKTSAQNNNGLERSTLIKNSLIKQLDLYNLCHVDKEILSDSGGLIKIRYNNTACDIEYKDILIEKYHRVSTSDTTTLQTFIKLLSGKYDIVFKDHLAINARQVVLVQYQNSSNDTLVLNGSGTVILNSHWIVSIDDFIDRIETVFPNSCK